MNIIILLTVVISCALGLPDVAISDDNCFNGGILRPDHTCLCPSQYSGDHCQTGSIYMQDDTSVQIDFPNAPTTPYTLTWKIVALCDQCGLNLQVPIMPDRCATIGISATLNSSVVYFKSECSSGQLVYSDSQLTTVTYYSDVYFPIADKIIVSKADNCVQTGCKNFANCTHDDAQRTFCKCSNGYGGKECQIDEYCGTNPCKNGGTCSHAEDGPLCSCADRVKGQFCTEGYCDDFVVANDFLSSYKSPLYPSGDFQFTSCNLTIKTESPNDIVAVHLESVKLSVASDSLDIYEVIGASAESLASINYHNQGLFNKTLTSELGVIMVNFTSHHPFDGFSLNYEQVFVNYCDTNNVTCHNNGSCEVNSHRAYCYCDYPYFGQYCQNKSYDICDNIHQPCLHSGTCHPGSGANYTCTCPPQYTGPQCQINITDGSVFNSMIANVAPQFAIPTAGNMCEKYCFHGGICFESENRRPTCACPDGFEGERCETTTTNVDEN